MNNTKKLYNNSIIVSIIFISIVSILILIIPMLNSNSFKKVSPILSAIRLSLSFSNPGVTIKDGIFNINTFGCINYNDKLVKLVNDEWIEVGTIDLFMLPWGKTKINVSWHPNYTNKYVFIAPENGQDESTNISDDTWEKLSLMPQSSICEMAFSLDRYYNVEEIPILKESDILCKYYILDTGENISNDSPHYFGFDEQYWSIATRSEEFDIIKKPPFPCGFIDKIEWMLNYDDIFKQIAPYLANNTTLKERHEYLRKNGLFTYAIIVEGKASDLIELRKIGNIMYPQFYP